MTVPRIDRAWGIAGALSITQTLVYGTMYYAYGVVTVPMERDLGLDRAQTSAAFSLGLLLAGLASPWTGRIVDRHGGRTLMAVGSLAGFGAMLAWSTVDGWIALMAVQAAIGVVMAATSYEVAFAVVARWFAPKPMRALLLVTTVAGFASTIFVPLTVSWVERFGWRDALVLLSFATLATAPLHALVLRARPVRRRSDRTKDDDASGAHDGDDDRGGDRQDSHARGEGNGARARRTFWSLAIGFTLDRMVLVAVGVHAVPLLLERALSPATVAAVAGSIGAMQVLGRWLFAPAAAKMSLQRLAEATYLLRALSLFALLVPVGAAGPWIFAVSFGIANGASTLARAGLIAERFDARWYGRISGRMNAITAVPQTMAPLGVGAMHVAFKGYDVAVVVLLVTAALAAWVLRGARR